MNVARLFGAAALCAVTCFGGAKTVPAQDGGPLDSGPLDVFFADVIENHDRILASRADVDAASERSIEALGGWYPELNVSGSLERYRLERTDQDTVIAPAQSLSATITQMLWDFGSTNAAIERARLEHVQAEIGLVRTRQDLIAEALSAYISLIQSADVVVFAKRSEENIRRQTGLEEARIEAGSGLTTDLLQAKTQLAGAQARRVDAEGAFEIALNRYRAVFGSVPANLDALSGVDVKRDALPANLESAIQEAFIGNPDLRLASIDISLAEQDRIATRADSFAPTFEIVGERSMTKNEGGIIGRRNESSIKLEMSFPFNLGFTSVNTLRASQSDVISASRTMADLQRATEERVRNAWKSLETAEARAGYLFDQAGIARAFLGVAVQERQLGQRSLIDVLSGETSLINAQSDAIAAEAEVLLAVVELYAASGALTYDVIETVARPDRAEMLAPIPGLTNRQSPDPAMIFLDSPQRDRGAPESLAPFQAPSDTLPVQPESALDPNLPNLPNAPAQSSGPPQPEGPDSGVDPSVPQDVEPPQGQFDGGDGAPEAPTEPAVGSFLQGLQQTPSFDSAPQAPPVLPATSGSEGQPTEPSAVPAPEPGEQTDLDNPLFDWAQ